MSAVASHRRISVQVGAASVPQPPGIPPLLAMVAIAPAGTPLLAELYPDQVVRAPNQRREHVCVEQVRLSRGQDLSRLPGLSGDAPSLLRDSVRLAFASGATSLDVVYLHIEGALPWELDRPEMVEVLQPLLEDLHETILVYPDLCGPAQLGPTAPVSDLDLWRRIQNFLRLHRDGWMERYQTVLLDAPDDGRRTPPLALSADMALVRWRGTPREKAAHAWRSGAAALAGLLISGDASVIQRVDGRLLPLPPGRWVEADRSNVLRRDLPTPPPPPSSTFVELDLGVRPGMARVEGELSFRAPAGAWPLPALRTVKSIHRRVVMAAELFTFQPVHPVQAVSLALAIAHVLKPFVQAGVIVGPDGRGLPVVDAEALRDPAAPGLVATLATQVRPWCNVVRLKVDVQAGSPPRSLMGV